MAMSEHDPRFWWTLVGTVASMVVMLLAAFYFALALRTSDRRDRLNAAYRHVAYLLMSHPSTAPDQRLWFGGMDIKSGAKDEVTRVEVTVRRFALERPTNRPESQACAATFGEHIARDAIRTECEEIKVVRHGQPFIFHSCPPCPHGKVKGYEMKDDQYQLWSRKMKEAVIERLDCQSDHPNAPVILAVYAEKPQADR